MTVFNTVELEHVCDVIAGQSPPSSTYNDMGNGLPFFQGKTDFGTINPNVRMWCSEPKKISLPGDILMSVRAPVGPTNVNNIEACIGRGLSAIRCSNKINQKFLLHYLRSNERNIADKGTGSTFKAITQKTLKALKIPLPSLAEQKKIAEVLDEADSLRQKDQQLIEHYTSLSQSLFLEMFGDPFTNPMGWECSTLKLMGVVSTGNTPSRAIPEYYGEHIEWVKTTNINTPNMYLTLAKEYLSLEGLKVARYVNPNSLLVTCIAGSKKVIGNVAIADRKVAFNQQINSFTPSVGNILYYYYLFIIGKKYIQSFSTNSMKGMINKSKFESIDFISPPVSLQNQFAERIEVIEKQKQQAQANLEKSEALFNSLLQRAFKGELTRNT